MRTSGLASGPVDLLVVNGDADARDDILRTLGQGNFRCREAGSGAECLKQVDLAVPNLLLLDLQLPDQSGVSVCRILRERDDTARIPIIVVSAQASEMDRIVAFESGVDDFLARPFYASELRARVEAVLRGFVDRGPEPIGRLRGGPIEVDPQASRATVGGERVDLTAREFSLLVELVREGGRVVRRRQLIERLWGEHAPHTDRAIDAHIKSIRRKLGPARGCIETVRGAGYRFVEDAALEG